MSSPLASLPTKDNSVADTFATQDASDPHSRHGHLLGLDDRRQHHPGRGLHRQQPMADERVGLQLDELRSRGIVCGIQCAAPDHPDQHDVGSKSPRRAEMGCAGAFFCRAAVSPPLLMFHGPKGQHSQRVFDKPTPQTAPPSQQ